jgi:hypothetical protein
MPAGRFDFIGEAALFRPISRQRASAAHRRLTRGLAFVATRGSGTAWLHVEALDYS